MATPQEIAKIKSLAQAGTPVEDATRQVMADSFGISKDFIAKRQAKLAGTPTPATPATPPAPQPVKQDYSFMQPQVPTQTPTSGSIYDTVRPTQTPVQPTPQAPMPVPEKTQDFNASQGREAEIIKNLNE
jgi:hypothetical protein